MTYDALITLTKQALGNRVVTTDSTGWYGDRVNDAYRRICTFRGMVKRGGMRQPQFRELRFFELATSVTNTIDENLTDNFVTPATASAELFMITDLYDTTNGRWIRKPAKRRMRRMNASTTGVPLEWVPDGKDGALGYRIYPRPGTSSEAIDVTEYVYLYPTVLATTDSPVIPAAWHPAIWKAAAAEGARLLEWPDKATEMDAMFENDIAERYSPIEEASFSGGRRWMAIGSR